MAVIEESHERIDVGSTSSAPRDDLVRHNWNRILDIMERGVWLYDESKGELGFLE